MVGDDDGGEDLPLLGDGAVGEQAVRMLHQLALQFVGADVLAVAEDDELLAASGQEKETIVVDVSEIACAEPAVLVHHFGGLLGKMVVALHDVLAADEDLAVLDFNLVAGDGDARRTRLVSRRRREGDQRGGFGHAIAFQQMEAEPVEVLCDLRVVGGASRGDVAQMPPKCVLHLLEDFSGQPEGIAAGGDPEQATRDERGVDLLNDGLAEELHQARHGDDEGTLVVLEGGHDVGAGHALREDGHGTDGHRHDDRRHQRIGMVKGKQHQHAVVGDEDHGLHGAGLGIGAQIAEGEHDAFRVARGPRCVDDEGKLLVGTLERSAVGDRDRRNGLANILQAFDRTYRRLHQLGGGLERALRSGVVEDDGGCAVIQDIGNLLRRGHEVDGNDCRPCMPYRIHGHDPFRGVGTDDGDMALSGKDGLQGISRPDDSLHHLNVVNLALPADQRDFVKVGQPFHCRCPPSFLETLEFWGNLSQEVCQPQSATTRFAE